ncbi:hypothetical protein D047_3752B, partial [Vibrio parahaemolyticus VPTS-2010_2]
NKNETIATANTTNTTG